MRVVVFLLLVCVALTGCAMKNAALNPTRSEMCQNARNAFVDGSSRLQTPLGGEESDYWMRYKQGAKAAIAIYCLN